MGERCPQLRVLRKAQCMLPQCRPCFRCDPNPNPLRLTLPLTPYAVTLTPAPSPNVTSSSPLTPNPEPVSPYTSFRWPDPLRLLRRIGWRRSRAGTAFLGGMRMAYPFHTGLHTVAAGGRSNAEQHSSDVHSAQPTDLICTTLGG